MFEVRHNGNFVARYENEAAALESAKSIFGEDPSISVEPGGDFELHCRDGFIDSFVSEEAAAAALETRRASHAAHVERGGPEALRARFAKHPVLKGRPIPALHDDKDPELKVVALEGAEEKPGTEAEISASEIPASEMETDPAPAPSSGS